MIDMISHNGQSLLNACFLALNETRSDGRNCDNGQRKTNNRSIADCFVGQILHQSNSGDVSVLIEIIC